MSASNTIDDPSSKKFSIHLLDVSEEQYGDAILCEFGNTTVLIDGGHRSNIGGRGSHSSIPEQIGEILNQEPPYNVDLLIVTHAHLDHTGCLPDMVKKGLLRAEWALVADPDLGWGRTGDDDAAPSYDAFGDERARLLVTALHEETRTDLSSDAIERFLSDAADSEDIYREMLESLENSRGRPTNVVRYLGDNVADLEDAFKKIGLKVLGPSSEHLRASAHLIGRSIRDALDSVATYFSGEADADEEPDLADIYRRLVSNHPDDFSDADQRKGQAVNLQSIVTRFKYRGRRLLFAGDMQFARPEIGGDAMKESMAELLKVISQDGAFDFAKLSHHGSDNGFDEQIFKALGEPKLLAICAGKNSFKHPNKEILKTLKKLANETGMKWVRTDRNGRSTISLTEQKETIEVSVRPLNNTAINKKESEDVFVERETVSKSEAGGVPLQTPSSGSTIETRIEPASHITGDSQVVDVSVRIPHASTRVTVAIDVEPRGRLPVDNVHNKPTTQTSKAEGTKEDKIKIEERRGERTERRDLRLRPLHIAGGRTLPKLLFVTDSKALAHNIGIEECSHLMQTLGAEKHLLLDISSVGAQDSTHAASHVHQALNKDADIEGVVLIGGYDVIPAQKLFCLPSKIQQQMMQETIQDERDRFIVWSDDVYGDKSRRGFPQLPVSRIPDGKSADLVFNAIEAKPSGTGRTPRKYGVRNKLRPFAEAVYNSITGEGPLMVSAPTSVKIPPPFSVEGELIYLMLHGSRSDSTSFLGEESRGEYIEAVNLSNIPEKVGAVVFTGCCWGALTATPAVLAKTGEPIATKIPEGSLALKFLLHGAVAFIGCTGAHYSPDKADQPNRYRGAGLPMHEAFWAIYQREPQPAKALYLAKIAYLEGMPYSKTVEKQAIEYKILRQYTCLGLGW
jgi:beta-lactamase superfamily II metal-dependent hydrolase